MSQEENEQESGILCDYCGIWVLEAVVCKIDSDCRTCPFYQNQDLVPMHHPDDGDWNDLEDPSILH